MEGKKKYFTLYYASYLSLLISLVFFIRFLLNTHSFTSLVLLLLFIMLFILLYSICNKALHCEKGYSLIQAIHYFQACKHAGYHETNSKKDGFVLLSVAQQSDLLNDAEIQDLKECYLTGKDAEKSVSNPAIRFLWSLQFKENKSKGKGKRKH